MRPFLIGLSIFSAISLLLAACSQAPVISTSTSGTGGAPNCEGIYIDLTDKDGSAPCSICAHDNCCAEIAACRDDACILCANNSTGAGCGPESQALEDCANLHCLSTCSPGDEPRDK